MTQREELLDQLLDRLFPAQVCVPLRGREDLERFAHSINQSAIPVAFNTLHPKSGRTYLHINQAAQDFLHKKVGEMGGPEKYVPITAEAVAGALWLYLYGFEHHLNPLGLVDGAYNRQFIISELHNCDRIYTVRPQNSKWLDHLPRNYFDSEDFKNWMWINSAYTTEVVGIVTINKLIRQGYLKAANFREIDLIEVSVQHHYSYFQYLYEKKEVYEKSFHNSICKLQEHENGVTAEPLAGEREDVRPVAVE